MIELFDPTDGEPIATVPWLWLARVLRWIGSKHGMALDYAPPGEGWTH